MSVFYARQRPKIFPQGLYEESSTEKVPLGTIWELVDGRRFVYCKAASSGGPTGPGYLIQSAQQDAQQSSVSIAVAAAAGDTTVYFTNGADTHDANDYKDGYLVIEATAGPGQCLKISTSSALTSAGTGTLVLKDAVRTALTTSSTATVVKHPCQDVIVCPANTPTGVVIGVSPITPTASYYFWAQCAGVAAVLVDNSTTIIQGVPVQAYGDVAGACQVFTEDEEIPQIGVAIDIGAQNQMATIFLRGLMY